MKKKLLTLTLIAVMALAMCACGGTDTPDLSGEYQDEVSQRAELTLVKTADDSYEIGISWANSATETVYWSATGTFDGSILSYGSGEKHLYTYGEDGEVVDDVTEETGLSGTLTLGDDAKLTWAGATEEETAVFVLTSGADGE